MRDTFLVLEEMREFGPMGDRAISYYVHNWKGLFDRNKGLDAAKVRLLWTNSATEAAELLLARQDELLAILVDFYHLGLPTLPKATQRFLVAVRDLNRSLEGSPKPKIFSAAVRQNRMYEYEIFRTRHILSRTKRDLKRKTGPGFLECDTDRKALSGLVANFLGSDILCLSAI